MMLQVKKYILWGYNVTPKITGCVAAAALL